MKYLVDANVLSEPTRPSPDPRVIEWLRTNEPDIAVDPIVLGELQFGILILPRGTNLQNLEAALIRMAAAANRCRLVNANTPQEPSISESDQAETRLFLAQLLIVLKVLGVEVFDKPAPPAIAATLYFLAARGLRAEGYETDSGFVVRRGSDSPKTEAPSTAASIVALRNELRRQGVFAEQPDKLLLAHDYSFSSPSQAASALLGRTANGRIEWTTADGRSLKQVQDAALK